jgi:hypothetical protein
VDKSTGRVDRSTLELSPVDRLDTSTGLPQNNLEVLMNLVTAGVAQAIVSNAPSRSPLWYMGELERAEAQGWLLTTAEVQQLIGVKPSPSKGTSSYQRGSFIFTKAGKIGGQTAWQVTKNHS